MNITERLKQIEALRRDADAAYDRGDYAACTRHRESADWCQTKLDECMRIYDEYRSEGQSHIVSCQYAGLL